MMAGQRFVALFLLAAFATFARAQEPGLAVDAGRRIAVWAGLGVGYIHAADIITIVKSTAGSAAADAPYFKAGAEFFGACEIPVSERWSVKVEYVHLLMTYNVTSAFSSAGAEYDVVSRMPMVVGQYLLADDRYYALKLGIGAGVQFGALHTTFFTIDDTYSATGFCAKAELEGLTAISDNLYAVLGAEIRWAATPGLANGTNSSPSAQQTITLAMVAPSARIGVAYLF
jgi:hypothetical protein